MRHHDDAITHWSQIAREIASYGRSATATKPNKMVITTVSLLHFGPVVDAWYGYCGEPRSYNIARDLECERSEQHQRRQ
jgi:hypothetical protein